MSNCSKTNELLTCSLFLDLSKAFDCCDHDILRDKLCHYDYGITAIGSPSGMCAKLRTVVASNNRDHAPRSLYYCLFAPRIYIEFLRAHPVRGESHSTPRHRRCCNSMRGVSHKLFSNYLCDRMQCTKKGRLNVHINEYLVESLKVVLFHLYFSLITSMTSQKLFRFM